MSVNVCPHFKRFRLAVNTDVKWLLAYAVCYLSLVAFMLRERNILVGLRKKKQWWFGSESVLLCFNCDIRPKHKLREELIMVHIKFQFHIGCIVWFSWSRSTAYLTHPTALLPPTFDVFWCPYYYSLLFSITFPPTKFTRKVYCGLG